MSQKENLCTASGKSSKQTFGDVMSRLCLLPKSIHNLSVESNQSLVEPRCCLAVGARRSRIFKKGRRAIMKDAFASRISQ